MNKCRIICDIGNSCAGEDEFEGTAPKTIDDVVSVLDKINPMKVKFPLPSFECACASSPKKVSLVVSDHRATLSFKTLEGKMALIKFIEI